MKYVMALLLASAVTGCAAKERQVQGVLDMSKDHFKNTAAVEDSSLDTIATINTFKGLPGQEETAGLVWDDNFLRAFVHKDSGRTSFQLYQVIIYQGDGWRFYDTVSHETPSGPQSKSVTVIKRDVHCTGHRYSGCTYVETVAFDVEESLLRTFAAKYSPGGEAGWGFKFNARSGTWYMGRILYAETAGLLGAVDDYINSKGIVPRSATPS